MVVGRLLAVALLGWSVAGVPAAGTAVTDAGASAMVAPGGLVRQGHATCTIGYVDVRARIAFTAGHCRGEGPSTTAGGTVLGQALMWRDDASGNPSITRGRYVTDFEVIGLAPGVQARSAMADGRSLMLDDAVDARSGQTVCVQGVVSGRSCGVVDVEANGWFTMNGPLRVTRGDSGAPVYVERPDGSAVLVGLLIGRWGAHPAAVSWKAVTDQVIDAVGAPTTHAPVGDLAARTAVH
jgi:hypothetical protein